MLPASLRPLTHDSAAFRGTGKEDYVMPAAVHELAVIAWDECCSPPAGTPDEVAAYRRAKLNACQAELDKAKAWEPFVLEARLGMRVQCGLETLAWFRRKMDREAAQ